MGTSSLPRVARLQAFAFAAVVLLLTKVLVSIVIEYRRYFPPDFDSAFLTGRETTFTATYAAAFYVHILSGPLALLLGAFLMSSGARKRFARLHRLAGRLQMALVLLALVPSGLIMARQAFAGPIAGAGFAALSLATGATALAAMAYAMRRKVAIHQRWATRCFLLLVSPLLLRLVSGFLIVMHWESPWAYCANAWLSWLVPWAVLEAWWWFKSRPDRCGNRCALRDVAGHAVERAGGDRLRSLDDSLRSA
jgi:uncharacterized membrane protein